MSLRSRSPAELFKYDVVILRDVPRQLFRAGGDTTESRLQHIVQHVVKRGGGLIVTGGQDVYRAGGYETSALAEILLQLLPDLLDVLGRDERRGDLQDRGQLRVLRQISDELRQRDDDR